MKRLFLSIGLVFFIMIGCDFERGSLPLEISADKENPTSGTEVTFSVAVQEGEIVKTIYEINNSDGILEKSGEIETATFSHNFTKADTYTVSVTASTKKDYGKISTQLNVLSNIEIPEWEINNPTVMGGDFLYIDLASFEGNEEIKSVDLRLVEPEEKRVEFFTTYASGTVTIDTSNILPGAYNVMLNIYDKFENSSSSEKQVIILDPNNPVKITFSASKNDFNYENTIFVSGTVETPNPLTDLKLVRTCYYGREEGILPLAEPKASGGIDYFEDGREIVSHTETYSILDSESLLSYDETTGEFSFTDPMPYYNENGAIEESNFKWSYAKFDREAWKYIKRKQHFDLEKAVSVEYKLVADTEKGSVSSGTDRGYPYLGRKELAYLFMWQKDVTMNRLWKMQVPRYAWGKTLSWLESQSANGQATGNASFTKSGLTSGYGRVSNYSDWTGFKVSTASDITMSISISTNNKQAISYSFNIETPLYKGKIDLIGLGVRDYTLQWGMWIDNDQKGGATGSVKIYRDGINGSETITTAELLEMLPLYNSSAWAAWSGNGYDEKDYTGLGHNPSSWTKIHFYYPPTPEGSDGVWGTKESNWIMNYQYN